MRKNSSKQLHQHTNQAGAQDDANSCDWAKRKIQPIGWLE